MNSHRIPTPHDAEEHLRPYLYDVREAGERLAQVTVYDPPEDVAAYRDTHRLTLRVALNEALDLLGVQQWAPPIFLPPVNTPTWESCWVSRRQEPPRERPRL
jgi:FPC/CPF motif-containing protein YcgG